MLFIPGETTRDEPGILGTPEADRGFIVVQAKTALMSHHATSRVVLAGTLIAELLSTGQEAEEIAHQAMTEDPESAGDFAVRRGVLVELPDGNRFYGPLMLFERHPPAR